MPPNLDRVAFPPRPIDTVAVAACRSGNGTHVGVAYRGPDGAARLLHLAFHLDLRDDDFRRVRPRYVCVVPNLHQADLVALAGYCRRIFLMNSAGRIPYNLAYEPETGFDPDTGDLVLPGTATGMSCSTFVLHLFRSSGNPLLDVTGWPAGRPGDRERQEELVRWMEATPSPAYQAQASRIRGQIGCPRVRSEDVAGGCLEDELPARFEQCDPNGRAILAMLAVINREP
jgi:hypothetical protein